MQIHHFSRHLLLQELSNVCSKDEITSISLWFEEAIQNGITPDKLENHLKFDIFSLFRRYWRLQIHCLIKLFVLVSINQRYQSYLKIDP